jgi:hypothetical protein
MFLILLIVPFIVKAEQLIDINLNNQEFRSGEEVEFTASFKNIFSKPIKGIISCNISSTENKFISSPLAESIDLKVGETKESIEYKMKVTEFTPSGQYRASAEVRDENGTLVTKGYKDFIISGTKKEIDANLSLCIDEECTKKSSVFIKGDKIFIKINSEIDGLNINSTINNESISFENNIAVVKAKKEGSFIIDIELNKEGYHSKKLNKDFGILDAPANIKSSILCNPNNKCERKEDVQNCPQDCTGNEKRGFNLYYLLGLFCLFVVIAVISVFYYRKNRNNDF